MPKCSKCTIDKSVDDFAWRNKTKGVRKGTCKQCNNWSKRKTLCQCGELKHPRSELCRKCRFIKNQNEINYDTITLGEKIYDKHKYAKYSYIRYYARKVGIEQGFKCCQKCGYNKHFEVCHIKAISEYSKDTLLKEINNPSNLIPLCPNCHWEFDNGLLKI